MHGKRIFFLLCTLFVGGITAQILPPDFYDTRFSSGFERPLGMDFDPSGRLFVFEQAGRVWIIDTTGQRLPDPLIDISERVSQWHDHGLLGFCLDRDFLENGYFYLLYAVDRYWEDWHDQAGYVPDSSVINAATWGRVVRFSADPATDFTTVVPDSRHVLMGAYANDGIPIFYNFHGLGKIKQADDRTLLISVGDGANNSADIGEPSENNFVEEAIEIGAMSTDENIGSYRSQYLGSLQGKILRIHPEFGGGVSSNPFYIPTEPRAAASRIWALGLRNPYRFTIVPNSGSHDPEAGNPGTLIIGDVGNGGWEEINIAEEGGLNFGWPHYEGPSWSWPFRSKDDVPNQMAPNPLAGQNGCPEFLGFKETYLRIRPDQEIVLKNPCDPSQVFEYAGNPRISNPALTWSNSNWNPPARAGIVGFDADQQTTIIDLGNAASQISGENFAGYSAMAGFQLNLPQWPPYWQERLFFFDFSGWIKTAKLDATGRPISIEPFGADMGRILALEQNPVTGKLFYLKQSHEVRQISFGGNPPPVAVANGVPRFGGTSLSVTFDALASSDQNDPTSSLTYHWDFGDGTTGSGPTPTHTFTAAGNLPTSFTVLLRVEDPLGASATDSLVISLNNTPPDVEIITFQDGDFYPIRNTNLLRLRANASDAEHPIESLSFAWQTFLHHNDHFHPEPIDESQDSRLFLEPLGCDGEEYYFRVHLRVTDPEGLFTEVEQRLYPDCSQLPPVFGPVTVADADGFVEVSWSLDSNEDGVIEVQRSGNFTDFEPLATLPHTQTEYRWVDAAPLQGNNVYRLKFIPASRRLQFSELATTSWPKPADFSLFPNPTTNGLISIVSRTAYVGGQLTFQLFDAQGKRLVFTNWEAENNANGFAKDIILPSLPGGNYLYSVEGPGFSQSGSIVIRQ